MCHVISYSLLVSERTMMASYQATDVIQTTVTSSPRQTMADEQINMSEKEIREYGCSNVDRVRHMRKICRQTQISEYKYETARIGKNNTVFLIYTDDDRKLLYCRIGKVGSSTFMDFLVQTKLGTDSKHTGHTDKFLEKSNIKQICKVPVSEINAKYKDYTKIVAVRHPLQRLVSAHYEVMIRRQKYKQNNSTEPVALDEFLRNVTGNLMDHYPHWTRYHNRCKLCSINYHYIIQTETMESDISKMADVFRNSRQRPSEVQLKHINIGVGNISQTFRHDYLLREFQLRYPIYMQRLLRLYRDDMQLFDYGWDSENMMSLCQESRKSTKCCT